jgi:RNA-directed DNA polymerase
MLTALETGVKGDVWFSLIDKVYSPSNLESAYAKVCANKGAAGVDHVTLERFGRQKEKELLSLHEQLRSGRYAPNSVRRTWIPKGNGEQRPLGIPTVRDRIVQTALRNVLEPIFEREFAEHSYGFRPGRSAKDALRCVDDLLKRGYRYVVDADIKGYFDAIPKAALLGRVRERVADSRILALAQSFLDQPVKDKDVSWIPTTGTPQGAVISPLLANIYLNPLDHLMAGKGYEMIRYADDFVVMCKSADQAENALETIRAWMDTAQLTLHPEKTRVVKMRQGEHFDFLGYRFKVWRNKITRQPRPKSMRKFRDAIRSRTRRTNGHSMERIIREINPVIRGWFEYFKHSTKSTFPPLDRWIRVRLRSILRKRRKRKGRGRGHDHFRWPNKYFAERGLVNLTRARALVVKSSPRQTINRRAVCWKSARTVRREGRPG